MNMPEIQYFCKKLFEILHKGNWLGEVNTEK